MTHLLRLTSIAFVAMTLAVAAHAQTLQPSTPAGLRFIENRGQIVDAAKHPRPWEKSAH